MPELQRPDFVNRAAGEVDRLRREIRQGVRGTEEVLTEYWENLQLLLDDLLGWVSSEVERIGIQGEEQRRQLESRVRDLAGSAGGVVMRAGDAIGLGPRVDPSVKLGVAATPESTAPTSPAGAGAKQSSAKKPAAKKPAAKKSTAKKSTAKKSAARKSTAKKSTAKKSAARKPAAKKSAAKKSTTKKPVAKKSAAKKAAPKQPASE